MEILNTKGETLGCIPLTEPMAGLIGKLKDDEDDEDHQQ